MISLLDCLGRAALFRTWLAAPLRHRPDRIFQSDQLRREVSIAHDQHPRPARQREPPGPGGAGIEQDGVAVPVNCRAMAMSENADVGLDAVQPFAGLLRETPALEQDMPDRDRHSGAPDDARTREPAALKVIDISRYGNHRGDASELPENGGIADIAGMNNRRHTGKVIEKRRIEEPVRIGDDSDPYDALRIHGAATG